MTASDDRTAKLWDVDNGRELLTLEGHFKWVWAVAVSADGKRIVTGGSYSARLWEAE